MNDEDRKRLDSLDEREETERRLLRAEAAEAERDKLRALLREAKGFVPIYVSSLLSRIDAALEEKP